MKKLISTLAFVLGVVALSFAQDAKNTAISQGAKELANSKETGVYVYTLPEGVTQEEVTKMASYYPDYFTVSYDASSREASVEITGETAEEMMENGKNHVHSQEDEGHQNIVKQMEELGEEGKQAWMQEFKGKFDALPEA